jgi:hypothetical protein
MTFFDMPKFDRSKFFVRHSTTKLQQTVHKCDVAAAHLGNDVIILGCTITLPLPIPTAHVRTHPSCHGTLLYAIILHLACYDLRTYRNLCDSDILITSTFVQNEFIFYHFNQR